MGALRQFSTFLLDGLLFGVDVNAVQEILRYQEMAPVPLAPSVVAGLINLRGQVITALDLRRRLDLTARPPDERPMNVIIRSGDEIVSFLVDEICDVLEVDEACFEPLPDMVQGVTRDLICGEYKLEDRLLLVLNTKQILTFNANNASLGSPS